MSRLLRSWPLVLRYLCQSSTRQGCLISWGGGRYQNEMRGFPALLFPAAGEHELHFNLDRPARIADIAPDVLAHGAAGLLGKRHIGLPGRAPAPAQTARSTFQASQPSAVRHSVSPLVFSRSSYRYLPPHWHCYSAPHAAHKPSCMSDCFIQLQSSGPASLSPFPSWRHHQYLRI